MSVSSCFSISIVESPELNRLISLAFSEERDIRLCVANNLSLLLTPPTSEYRGIRGAIFSLSLSLSRYLSIYCMRISLPASGWVRCARAVTMLKYGGLMLSALSQLASAPEVAVKAEGSKGNRNPRLPS